MGNQVFFSLGGLFTGEDVNLCTVHAVSHRFTRRHWRVYILNPPGPTIALKRASEGKVQE